MPRLKAAAEFVLMMAGAMLFALALNSLPGGEVLADSPAPRFHTQHTSMVSYGQVQVIKDTVTNRCTAVWNQFRHSSGGAVSLGEVPCQ